MIDQRTSSETGSAIILILMAIAMFAALSYVVFRDSRSGISSLTAEQARIAAQEVLSYADGIKKTVQTLRLRGCSDTQINLYSANGAAGVGDNAGAPADDSCDVFSVAGGNMNYQDIPSVALSSSATTTKWWFDGRIVVKNIGTTSPELIVWAQQLKPEVCNALNQAVMGADSAAEVVSTHTTGFSGTYSAAADGVGNDAGSIYDTQATGCLQDGSNYDFYAVLIAR